jgi:hypothetical protein
MMLVDADPVEAQAIGEFKLVKIIVVDLMAEPGIIEGAGNIHPDAVISAGKVGRKIRIRHQVERGKFHR